MSLLTRLVGPLEGEVKLPVHQFMAALAEYFRGAINKQQIVNAFNLSNPEKDHLQEFLDGIDGTSIERTLIHDVLMLGEADYYSLQMVRNRLGLTNNA